MEFRLAEAADEPHLRALLRADDMPGWVRLRFEREPDYFRAAATQGPFHQTIVATRDGAVLGSGSRSIRDVYIDGQVRPLGYLGGLRSRPGARRRTGLARGYAFLRSLHADGRTRGYLTTVIEANTGVRTLLTSRRAGLPHYLDLGAFHTFVWAAGRRDPGRLVRRDLAVSRACERDWPGIVAFLAEHGSRRQFFPVVRHQDLGTPLWRGLEIADFLIARDREGYIAGIVACWDQNDFKQTRVLGYAPPLALARPVVSAALRFAKLPALPPAGRLLRTVFASLVCVREDTPGVLSTLLAGASRVAAEKRADHLCAGFHARDPRQKELNSRAGLRYDSRLYWVCWPEDLPAFHALDPTRTLHLEPALL